MSASELSAICQVARRFSVLPDSSKIPWFGRLSWRETGCIQRMPSDFTAAARPRGEPGPVVVGSLYCGLRDPQLDIP